MERNYPSMSSVGSNRASASAPQCPLTADLPCNDKGADYNTLANQASAYLLSEVVNFDEGDIKKNRSNYWKFNSEKKGVKIYTKIDQFTKQQIYLCYTHVKCSSEEAMDFILDPDTRFRYDNMMKENFMLERFSDTTTFCYSLLQTKNCIAEYMVDLCYLANSRSEGDRSVIAYSSILDHPKAPSSAGIERAWLYHSGFVMEPWVDEVTEEEGTVRLGEEGKGIKLWYLTHADLMLELPTTLIHLLEEKQCIILAYLRRALESVAETNLKYKSSNSLHEAGSYLDEGEFEIGMRASQESLDMNLEPTSMTPAGGASSIYSGGEQRAFGRSYNDPSPPVKEELAQIPGISYSNSLHGSQPDLCFWSIDDDAEAVSADSLEYLSDYVTMANSAAASLFREYINIIETIRFSSCCPDKLIWKVLERNDEMWVLEKKGSTIQCMAGVANIRASEREVTDFVSDPRSRFSFDPTLHKTYVVDEINENLRIVYAQHKTKHCFIGHGRDMLYFSYNRKEGDRRILAHASCTHPKCPEDPKITRARMYETGFIIEPLPEPGLTNIVYVIKIDMRGSIPASLVRMIKRKQPHVLFAIKKYFER